MKNQEKRPYFFSLDIGTNSIGYAAVYENYDLVKYQQHPVWGVHLFDKANLASERRAYRVSRRRLDRRQQRIQLLRELFAEEIGVVDPQFFSRIDSSSSKKDPGEVPYAIFADKGFTDRDFYNRYPTIHHLICELIDSDASHDVRLVYVACAWLLAHRGHFFNDVAKEKIDEIISFEKVYGELEQFVEDQGFVFSWKHLAIDKKCIGDILKSSSARTEKYKQLKEYLHVGTKKSIETDDETIWFDEDGFLRLLCGLEVKLLKFLPGADAAEIKLSLDVPDEKMEEMLSELDEDTSSLFLMMKKVFDWSLLADIIGEGKYLSASKVRVYEKHGSDLKDLKYIVRKYLLQEDYREIFRSAEKNNYVAYCGDQKQKKISREDFYKFLGGKLKNIQIEGDGANGDSAILSRILLDIFTGKFLPKQVVSDNRTIPYQLYWKELSDLLTRASSYLPFLNQRDADGLTVREKVLSIMEFRIPYFVGPLNQNSPFAWIKRKAAGRILPWNFDEKVDLDASEEAFISRMSNSCTYLPGEPALPGCSLLYQRFAVLNLLNNLHVNGVPVTVECKQKLYSIFAKYRKITKKTILNFLLANNLYDSIDINRITGIDDTVNVSLSSWKIFAPFLEKKILSVEEAEQIISKRTFTADNGRFSSYLRKNFPALTPDDIRKISAGNFQGFGRISRKFLTEPLFFDPRIGSRLSIINLMWDRNLNLSQLMSDRFPFAKMVQDAKREYYSVHPVSLLERLDEMYVSNAVKRPIIRALKIVDEVTRAIGYAPSKIFVEMARDVNGPSKRKRTKSRKEQLLEIYRQFADEDVRRLRDELEKTDESALQRDVLFLYFMQLGHDMYSKEVITDLSLYNKEHIYPQSKVKDDSLLNNIVLVNSKTNAEKRDIYPIEPEIREKMTPFWKSLLEKKLISDEKFFRLTRGTPFSSDEKWGFINRQLVETRQSTKVVAELLKERYPESQIVYVKAGLVSDFRHEFGLVKSRAVNDLHHGKDAYLDAVVGNVWHEYFTREWFFANDENYSVKTDVLFGHPRKSSRGNSVWRGEADLGFVRGVTKRNYMHLTSYAYCQRGGLFDQNPVSAAPDLVPLKKDKPTEIYGGYRKTAAAFFIFALVEKAGKRKTERELMLVPVDLMVADKFLHDESFAVDYIRRFANFSEEKNLSVQFPLGMKVVKVKSVFEVDNGLRFRLNAKSGGGSKVLISLFSPLLLDSAWEEYIRRLETFCEKQSKNPGIIYSEKYDKFSADKNVELYDILLGKMRGKPFGCRPANPQVFLETARGSFVALSPSKQAEILLEIVASFGTESGGGIDLREIKGRGQTAVTQISTNISNWKKIFTTVQLVDSDSSGLHETKSVNLLNLI